MYYLGILYNCKTYEQSNIFFFIDILEEKNHKKLIQIYSYLHEIAKPNILLGGIYKIPEIDNFHYIINSLFLKNLLNNIQSQYLNQNIT